jgi:archaellum biogenesis protein FlaJ (TadC family)
MEIKIDDQVIVKFNETQMKIFKHDISEDILLEDLARRMTYILSEKYKEIVKRLRKEWEQKFKEEGLEYIPLNDEKFCELVFESADYEDKKTRILTKGE